MSAMENYRNLYKKSAQPAARICDSSEWQRAAQKRYGQEMSAHIRAIAQDIETGQIDESQADRILLDIIYR